MIWNYFHHSRSKLTAARFALFAISLMIFAPLISVFLQKDMTKMVPGMMYHHAPMIDEHHVDHKLIQIPQDHAEACGYCVLLAHVPGVLSALAVLICAQMLRLRFQSSQPVLQKKNFFPWLYPHTRAPPQNTTFTY